MHITTFAHGDLYFGSRRHRYSHPALDQLFYLSFEDALWDFLKHKVDKVVSKKNYFATNKTDSKAVVLFPDFFCVDVWENCKNHGYKIATYKVEDDLTVRTEVFWKSVKQYNPDVVFIFHTFGIQNQLLNQDLFKKFAGWVIEDAVHRLIKPAELTLYSNRHIVIDSTRKLTPLPGSCIWAQKGVLDYMPQGVTLQTQEDAKKALNFWSEFQQLLSSGDFTEVQHAYQLLNSGDNLIGDSELSITLDSNYLAKRNYFNYLLIQQTKRQHYELYEQLLATILRDERFVINWSRPPDFLPHDLAFYPLILKSDYAFLLKDYLLQNYIQTFVEFSDSPWAINKNILCLPLGPHVSTQQVAIVCKSILDWFDERSRLM